MPSGMWVVDQWVSKTRTEITKRLITVPPRWKQRTADGSLTDMSNNALAFFVIERCAR
ncbi:MAG: BPSL0067 family protein [Rhodoferax sp.]|nr:BPSL0067 family protein [Rhodoferax sp.]